MISFFNYPISNTVPKCSVNLKQLHNYIIGTYAKVATEALRQLMNNDVRRAFKAQNFDYVTFSGTFSSRKINNLINHSGLMCFDIDKIESEERLQSIKSALIDDSLLHTVLLFRSPSGNGLKWVVEVPDINWLGSGVREIEGKHKLLYDRVRKYLQVEYNIISDATSDIARPCYLCHDPDAYYDEVEQTNNPNHPFLISCMSMENRPQPTEKRPLVCDSNNMSDWDIIEMLVRRIEHRGVDITGEYLDWVRLGFAFSNSFGELGRGFYHRISQFHPNYSMQETNRQYDNCLKSNRGEIGLGSAILMMKKE